MRAQDQPPTKAWIDPKTPDEIKERIAELEDELQRNVTLSNAIQDYIDKLKERLK
jgi:hypothetical protein